MDPVQRPAAGSLGAGAVRGALWNGLSFGVGKGLLFVTTVILARLLPPEDFGLLALGLIVIVYLDVVGDLGLGAAVIYRRERDPRDTSTAVILAGASGIVIAALALLCAPLLSAAFGEPRLTAVVQVLTMGFLLRMLGIVQRSKLEKDLDFRRRLVPEVSGNVLKGVVSVGLALAGAGVWSLVWGQVVGVGVTTVLYWVMANWRFSWHFDRQVARELLRFGLPVTVLGGLAALLQTLDVLIIGARLGVDALGLYTIAFRIPELFVLHLCYIISGALFPAYAKVQDDSAQLRSAFRSTLRLVSLVTTPLALGLAVVAPDLVPVLFGDRWLAAVPVMQVLAVYTLLHSLSFNVGDVYKATGRPGVLNKLAVLRLAVTAPVLWLVAPEGILAVAWALAAVAVTMTLLQLVVAGRLMKAPLRGVLGEFVPAAVAGGALLLGTGGLGLLLPEDLGAPARLALTVLVGGVLYVGSLLLVSRSSIDQVVRLLRPAAGDQARRASPFGGPAR